MRSESEVSNFGFAGLTEENVGSFEVTMDDRFLRQILQPLKNIVNNPLRLTNCQQFVLGFVDNGFQVLFLAQLGYYVAPVFTFQQRITFDHVGMVQFREQFGLLKQKIG